jgi:hypothetical protein
LQDFSQYNQIIVQQQSLRPPMSADFHSPLELNWHHQPASPITTYTKYVYCPLLFPKLKLFLDATHEISKRTEFHYQENINFHYNYNLIFSKIIHNRLMSQICKIPQSTYEHIQILYQMVVKTSKCYPGLLSAIFCSNHFSHKSSGTMIQWTRTS